MISYSFLIAHLTLRILSVIETQNIITEFEQIPNSEFYRRSITDKIVLNETTVCSSSMGIPSGSSLRKGVSAASTGRQYTRFIIESCLLLKVDPSPAL